MLRAFSHRILPAALAGLLIACGGGNATSDTSTGSSSGSGSADATPPSVPTSLVSSEVAANSTRLSWSAASDNIAVTGYQVYRDKEQVGYATGLSFLDAGLKAGTSYPYTVKACDAAGNCSAQSTGIAVTTLIADVASSIALMTQNHENNVHPLGIGSDIGWWAKPSYLGTAIMRTYPDANDLPHWPNMSAASQGWLDAAKQKYPGAWHGIVPWFTIFHAADANGVDLNKASNTGVVIGKIGLWFLSRSQRTWIKAGTRHASVWDGLYDKASGDATITTNPVLRTVSEGKLFAVPALGFVHGGWGTTRIPIDNGTDIAAVLVTVEHRLELIDPNQTDDRDQAKFIVQAAADYYPDEKTKSSDMVFQVNVGGSLTSVNYIPPVGIGPFLYATNNWRLSTMLVRADNFTEAEVLAAGMPQD